MASVASLDVCCCSAFGVLLDRRRSLYRSPLRKRGNVHLSTQCAEAFYLVLARQAAPRVGGEHTMGSILDTGVPDRFAESPSRSMMRNLEDIGRAVSQRIGHNCVPSRVRFVHILKVTSEENGLGADPNEDHDGRRIWLDARVCNADITRKFCKVGFGPQDVFRRRRKRPHLDVWLMQ